MPSFPERNNIIFNITVELNYNTDSDLFNAHRKLSQKTKPFIQNNNTFCSAVFSVKLENYNFAFIVINSQPISL